VLALAWSSTAMAAEPVTAMIGCRAEKDAAKRLACFDAAAADAERRAAAGELVAVNPKEQAAKAEREFGQSETARRKETAVVAGVAAGTAAAVPAAKPVRIEVDRIESTIVAAKFSQQAQLWTFQLSDGGVWRQTDGARAIDRYPAGSKVVVRKGTLGSFIMEVDGGTREVRVKRVN